MNTTTQESLETKTQNYWLISLGCRGFAPPQLQRVLTVEYVLNKLRNIRSEVGPHRRLDLAIARLQGEIVDGKPTSRQHSQSDPKPA